MLPVNYHHLYYFWITAKSGSISNAKRQLLVSQPTLSAQLMALEKSLGCRLLERSRRGVTLTAQGRVAYEYCERMFPHGEELAAAFRKGGTQTAPELRIGIDEGVARDVIESMRRFAREIDPKMRVVIIGGAVSDLRERLRRHALDVMATSEHIGAQLGKEFVVRMKARVPVSLAATRRAIKRYGFRRFPDDLHKMPLFVRTEDHPARRDFDRLLDRLGVEGNIEAQINDVDLIRRLVLRSEGAAPLDERSMRKDLKAKRLVRLNGRPTGLREHIWFVAPRRAKPNPLLRRAINGLLDVFRVV